MLLTLYRAPSFIRGVKLPPSSRNSDSSIPFLWMPRPLLRTEWCVLALGLNLCTHPHFAALHKTHAFTRVRCSRVACEECDEAVAKCYQFSKPQERERFQKTNWKGSCVWDAAAAVLLVKLVATRSAGAGAGAGAVSWSEFQVLKSKRMCSRNLTQEGVVFLWVIT